MKTSHDVSTPPDDRAVLPGGYGPFLRLVHCGERLVIEPPYVGGLGASRRSFDPSSTVSGPCVHLCSKRIAIFGFT